MTNRTDDFNRADSTASLGTPSDSGSDWVALSGTWGIATNQGYKVASGGTFQTAYLESSTSAVEVQTTLTVTGTSNVTAGSGLIARAADNSNYILALFNADNVTLNIYKKVAGSFTQLGSSYTGTISANDVFKLRLDSANLITFYQNGVSRVSVTDSAGSTNTKHGFYSYNLGARFDTFSITDIAAAGGIFMYRPVGLTQAVQGMF